MTGPDGQDPVERGGSFYDDPAVFQVYDEHRHSDTAELEKRHRVPLFLVLAAARD